MDRAPLVCLRLESGTIAAGLDTIDRHRAAVNAAILRVDRLEPGELASAGRLPGLAGIPVILACRRARDGGGWTGEEADRRALLGRLAGAGFAFVELEEDVPDRLAGARVLRTLHAAGVPGDLGRRLRTLARGPREVPQAVVAVRGAADLARLLEAAAGTRDLEKSLVGLGDAGLAARVLAARTGSLLCPVPPAGPAAGAGDPDPETLRGLYRFAAIGPGTPAYAVIGSPVMHSLSPAIHNRALAWLGIPGVYLPIPVDDLAAFMPAADLLGLTGLSVTVPHKEAVLPFLGERDPVVDRVGACNTLHRPDARAAWRGTNTDAAGFLAPLLDAAGGKGIAGARAAVIGAGGASRAVVAALADAGARVLVLNRTPERARALAARFGAGWAGLDAAGLDALAGHADIVVQATSAGMGDGGDPVPGYRFTGREIAYELVYAPRETAFLARARAAGCTVIPGIRMLLAQARGQFERFTGRVMPGELLETLEQEL